NIKARVTLNTGGFDSKNNPTEAECPYNFDQIRFNYRIIRDKGLRQQYLKGLQAFVSHFKANPSIDSYDALNEADGALRSIGQTRVLRKKCGWPNPLPTRGDFLDLLQQIRE